MKCSWVKCGEVWRSAVKCSDGLLVLFIIVHMVVCFVYFCFNSVSYVLLLCLYILIDMYALFCILLANKHSPATLTEGFPCSFLSCKGNARVYLAKTGHGPRSS